MSRLVLVSMVVLGGAPAAFAGSHTETRLEARTLAFSQEKSDEKYEVSAETAAGTSAGEVTESSKKEDFGIDTGLPFLGVATFNDGMAINASVGGLSSGFAVTLGIGREVNRTFEFGLATAMNYDGSRETEDKIANETKATIRCIPFARKKEAGTCVLTGQPSAGRVVFARAY